MEQRTITHINVVSDFIIHVFITVVCRKNVIDIKQNKVKLTLQNTTYIVRRHTIKKEEFIFSVQTRVECN